MSASVLLHEGSVSPCAGPGSDARAGAVLLQDGDDDVKHPVSYFSKKFNRHQRVYSTIEREALALVMAIKHFEVYVGSASAPVVVYTDHNPLVFINQMRNTNQKLMRWEFFFYSPDHDPPC